MFDISMESEDSAGTNKGLAQTDAPWSPRMHDMKKSEKVQDSI